MAAPRNRRYHHRAESDRQNGTAIWTGLIAGTYILEEVDPADGYSIIQSSETVYLADSGEQSRNHREFQNMPDGILLVRKVCATNPSVTLPNAEFKVTYADGTSSATATASIGPMKTARSELRDWPPARAWW